MFFVADTHFGHPGIISRCSRPFASVEEMDDILVANWNATVGPKDDVWHVGDFSRRGSAVMSARVFGRLNGRKRLVLGNHDDRSVASLPWMQPPEHLAFVRVGDVRLTLSHYGLRVWPHMHHGGLCLYGHSHGRLPGTRQSLDVGVDAWGYAPVSFERVVERLATLPPFDDPEERRRTSIDPSA